MAEKDLVSMAQAFSGLPIKQLLAAPLMAAAEANNQMALTQAKYILDTGFHVKKEKIKYKKGNKTVERVVDVYDPVIVDMKIKRPVIIPGVDKDGKPDPDKTVIDEVETVVSVPLISMLPVNSLAVDMVDVTFDMEVKSSYAQEKSQETQEKLAAESSFEAKLGFGLFSVSVSGSVAYSQENRSSETEKFEKSNSSRYHIQVQAHQQDQPRGLTLMLEQFAKNIGPFVLGHEESGNQNDLVTASSPEAVDVITAGGGQRAFVGTARVGE